MQYFTRENFTKACNNWVKNSIEQSHDHMGVRVEYLEKMNAIFLRSQQRKIRVLDALKANPSDLNKRRFARVEANSFSYERGMVHALENINSVQISLTYSPMGY